MIWKEIRDENIGCNSFLLGDEVSGKGLVVDPLGSVGAMEYILIAQESGISIEHIIETHIHADHRSAANELANKLGLKITFGSNADVNFDFEPVKDGDTISLGSIEIEVLETPGHTMESISLVVRDTQRGNEPIIVMSGDSLFVGDVGRPDLNDAGEDIIKEYSRKQFQSVKKIMELPDFTELHPAHYGASPCGGLFMSKKPSSTIGYERRFNVFTGIKDMDLFVEKQIKLLKPPPEEAKALRAQNQGPTME